MVLKRRFYATVLTSCEIPAKTCQGRRGNFKDMVQSRSFLEPFSHDDTSTARRAGLLITRGGHGGLAAFCVFLFDEVLGLDCHMYHVWRIGTEFGVCGHISMLGCWQIMNRKARTFQGRLVVQQLSKADQSNATRTCRLLFPLVSPFAEDQLFQLINAQVIWIVCLNLDTSLL